MGKPKGGGISAGDIINAGNAVWGIVKDNKPSSAAKSAWCSATPKSVKMVDIDGWRHASDRWNFTIENLYGIKCIECNFVLDYSYGGYTADMPDARFLNDIRVGVGSCVVEWGYELNANATVVGRPTFSGGNTKPVSRLALDVVLNYGTVLRSAMYTYRLTFEGNGKCVRRGG